MRGAVWLAAFCFTASLSSGAAPRQGVAYSRAAGPEHVMLRVVVLMRGKMEPTHAEDRTPRTATGNIITPTDDRARSEPVDYTRSGVEFWPTVCED